MRVSSRRARIALWVGATLAAGLAVTLACVAFWADLDTADKAASLVGAVLAGAGLVLSGYALLASPTGPHVTGERSVQAGGSVGRAVTGDRNRIGGVAPRLIPRTEDGTAPVLPALGDRGVSAGGHLGEGITGDGNQVP